METVNHECYVSLDVAKLLKEVGFDWECIMAYDAVLNNHIGDYGIYNHNKVPDFTSAPTLDVAQRWLREVKDEYVVIEIVAPGIYKVYILGRDCTSKSFKTYEEAQEEGIKAALEIILEKGE